ncbi:MAG: response regulator transcription factor [Anaerolineae bacterium]|nr:response regulator transcription factor [Anaerolineae bacterium]
MTTVFLLEDHQLARRGLKLLIETEGDLELVGESGHYANVVDDIASLKPDILIADLSSSGREFDVSRQINDRRLSTQVVMLSMYADDQLIQQAIDTGIAAFVLKEVGASELGTAIRSVIAGKSYYCAKQ